MATYSWTLTTGSTTPQNWSIATNWNTGGTAATSAPGGTSSSNGDIVQLEVVHGSKSAPTYTLAFDESSPWYIGSLTGAAGAILTFGANETLTINNGATFTGVDSHVQLNASSAALAIAGGGLTVESSDTLAVNAGSLSIVGGTTLNAAAMNIGNGAATVTADSLSATGGGALNVSGSTARLSVSGAASFTSSSNGLAITSGASVSFGTLTDNAGAMLTFSVNAGTLNASSMSIGDSLSLTAGSLISNGGITDSGTIIGSGTISAAVTGTGSVVASGGTLDITRASSGAFYVDGGSTLEFDAGLGTNVSTVAFNTGSTEVLDLTNLNSASPTSFTVSGFGSGNTIAIANAASFAATSSTVETAYDSSHNVIATITQTAGGLNNGTFTVCFAAGSRIRTEHGDVPVEQLAEGQRVAVLRHGKIDFTPITWIGQRRINLAAHPQPQTAAPVRIGRGAIGENLPERDLVLSPDHCLFLDGKLIPAKALINGMTIVQERSLPSVHYFHVEVDPHAVLLAEGLPVESYLDTGNRAYFENAGAALVLHPDFTINAGLKTWETDACAPLTVAPDAVQPMWQRLAERAEAMGFAAPQPETTQDADLHLVADGRVVRPMNRQDGRYVFALPAGSDSVRLVSRASIPSDLAAYLDDWRKIGVAVSSLTLRTCDGQQVIPADHPTLTRGWHTVETDGVTNWRWTDGAGELNLGGFSGPVILEVRVCHTTRYIVEAPEQARHALAA